MPYIWDQPGGRSFQYPLDMGSWKLVVLCHYCEDEQGQRVIDRLGHPSNSVWYLFFKELPGFYYDPEKNRYFRLLPGHNNYNPLTKESIHYKEMECKRLKLLEEDEQQKVGSVRLHIDFATCWPRVVCKPKPSSFSVGVIIKPNRKTVGFFSFQVGGLPSPSPPPSCLHYIEKAIFQFFGKNYTRGYTHL